jgi:hypothetical protein
MLVVQPVHHRNQSCVKVALAGLVTAEKKDCDTPRIECLENTDRPAADLYPQLSHLAVA